MRLVYKCGWDGQICDKVIPQVDAAGNVGKQERNNNPVISEDRRGWLICDTCDRCGNKLHTCGYPVLIQ